VGKLGLPMASERAREGRQRGLMNMCKGADYRASSIKHSGDVRVASVAGPNNPSNEALATPGQIIRSSDLRAVCRRGRKDAPTVSERLSTSGSCSASHSWPFSFFPQALSRRARLHLEPTLIGRVTFRRIFAPSRRTMAEGPRQMPTAARH
jgi:hypothetical protein